jgi:hypothetical protein
MILAGPCCLPADATVRRILPILGNHFTMTRHRTAKYSMGTARKVTLIHRYGARPERHSGIILLTFTA